MFERFPPVDLGVVNISEFISTLHFSIGLIVISEYLVNSFLSGGGSGGSLNRTRFTILSSVVVSRLTLYKPIFPLLTNSKFKFSDDSSINVDSLI